VLVGVDVPCTFVAPFCHKAKVNSKYKFVDSTPIKYNEITQKDADEQHGETDQMMMMTLSLSTIINDDDDDDDDKG